MLNMGNLPFAIMTLSYIGLSMREYGEYSEIEYSVIEKLIKNFVFDIGSNIGIYFSIPLAKKIGPKGKIFFHLNLKSLYLNFFVKIFLIIKLKTLLLITMQLEKQIGFYI